jgi:hypothetical protein
VLCWPGTVPRRCASCERSEVSAIDQIACLFSTQHLVITGLASKAVCSDIEPHASPVGSHRAGISVSLRPILEAESHRDGSTVLTTAIISSHGHLLVGPCISFPSIRVPSIVLQVQLECHPPKGGSGGRDSFTSRSFMKFAFLTPSTPVLRSHAVSAPGVGGREQSSCRAWSGRRRCARRFWLATTGLFGPLNA